ncbi:hypothetical protein [Veillonella ratti]|uniref:hypothetical protein n=1 Tax=Veillonella ratti TaxID=103892 RepID=UPI0013DFD431|nr:hypothetical protein [Veillonella ratti]
MNDKMLTIVENFETNYKETLQKHEDNLPPEAWQALYDLGADIKHALEELVTCIK